MSSSAPRDLWSDLADGDGNVARLFGTARGPASDDEFADEPEIIAAMERILDRSTLQQPAAVNGLNGHNGANGHNGRNGRNDKNGHNGRRRRDVNGTKIYRVGELEDAEIASRRKLVARFDALKAAAVVAVVGVLGLATAAASGMEPWKTLSILGNEPSASETAERAQRRDESGSDVPSGGQVGDTPPQADVPAGGGADPSTSQRPPSRLDTEEDMGSGSTTPPDDTEQSPEEKPPHGVGSLCDPPSGEPSDATTTTTTSPPSTPGPAGLDADPEPEADSGSAVAAEPPSPPDCGEDPSDGSTTTTTPPSTTTTTTTSTTVANRVE